MVSLFEEFIGGSLTEMEIEKVGHCEYMNILYNEGVKYDAVIESLRHPPTREQLDLTFTTLITKLKTRITPEIHYRRAYCSVVSHTDGEEEEKTYYFTICLFDSCGST